MSEVSEQVKGGWTFLRAAVIVVIVKYAYLSNSNTAKGVFILLPMLLFSFFAWKGRAIFSGLLMRRKKDNQKQELVPQIKLPEPRQYDQGAPFEPYDLERHHTGFYYS